MVWGWTHPHAMVGAAPGLSHHPDPIPIPRSGVWLADPGSWPLKATGLVLGCGGFNALIVINAA